MRDKAVAPTLRLVRVFRTGALAVSFTGRCHSFSDSQPQGRYPEIRPSDASPETPSRRARNLAGAAGIGTEAPHPSLLIELECGASFVPAATGCRAGAPRSPGQAGMGSLRG